MKKKKEVENKVVEIECWNGRIDTIKTPKGVEVNVCYFSSIVYPANHKSEL